MLKEDFTIQSSLRRLLIRSNIDYSKMSFGTVRGVVYIRGLFQLPRSLREREEESVKNLSSNTLYSFEKKVRSLPGVTDVLFQLDNWRKEKGQWVPIKLKEKDEADHVKEKKPGLQTDPEGNRRED